MASGTDALYLSGRAIIDDGLLDRLEEARGETTALGQALPFVFDGSVMALAPTPFSAIGTASTTRSGESASRRVLTYLRFECSLELNSSMAPDLARRCSGFANC